MEHREARVIARRLWRGHAAALLALAASLVLYALLFAITPATGDQDAALHAIYARFPTDPSRWLSVWSRPAFAIPYMLVAPLGYAAMRVLTVVVCAAAAWLTYRTARRARMPLAWLAIPLVLLEPALASVGTDAMTEPLFALILAGGLLLLASDRRAAAAIVLSLLPLTRPEGPFVLAVVALAWLPRAWRARDPRPLLLLAVGSVLWELTALVVTHDIRYLAHTFPWPASSLSATPHVWDHYIHRWPHIIGWGVLPLWMLGLWRAPREPIVRLAVAITAFVFVVHSYLFATGSLASTGFDRYFATLAPLTGLIALAGAGQVARPYSRLAWRRVAWLIVTMLLVATGVQSFVMVDSNPYNHMAAATQAMARAAMTLDPGVRTRPVLSADQFGYVFLDVDSRIGLPVGSRDTALAAIDTLPRGTVVLWDNVTGDWWYHLAVEDFVAHGYRLQWERRFVLQSPRGPWYHRLTQGRWWQTYYAIGRWPIAEFRQALLVRE